MGELSKHDQMTVARMLLAVMNSDFMQLILVVHQAGWIPPGTDQDALAREMRRTVGPMVSKPMHELDFAGILIQVMDIARRFHLEIPPQLMLLLKTLVHVEGLGTDLYPELDIWKLAKPILTDWIKTQMNPQKNLKELGQKIPDLLLGAQDLPSLMIDSLNGLKISLLGIPNNCMSCKVCACKWNISKNAAGCLAASWLFCYPLPLLHRGMCPFC